MPVVLTSGVSCPGLEGPRGMDAMLGGRKSWRDGVGREEEREGQRREGGMEGSGVSGREVR
eukprot:51348-Rhodomonas_salina.1